MGLPLRTNCCAQSRRTAVTLCTPAGQPSFLVARSFLVRLFFDNVPRRDFQLDHETNVQIQNTQPDRFAPLEVAKRRSGVKAISL
jgi:hypothetical protein